MKTQKNINDLKKVTEEIEKSIKNSIINLEDKLVPLYNDKGHHLIIDCLGDLATLTAALSAITIRLLQAQVINEIKNDQLEVTTKVDISKLN